MPEIPNQTTLRFVGGDSICENERELASCDEEASSQLKVYVHAFNGDHHSRIAVESNADLENIILLRLFRLLQLFPLVLLFFVFVFVGRLITLHFRKNLPHCFDFDDRPSCACVCG